MISIVFKSYIKKFVKAVLIIIVFFIGLIQDARRVSRKNHFEIKLNKILSDLVTSGGAISHLDQIDCGFTYNIVEASDIIIPSLHRSKPKKGKASYVASLSEQDIVESGVILWGLNEEIIDLVEAYIGLPAYYRGVTVRRDIADGKEIETRLWHKDGEDTRIVKIIIYLNDVDSNSGPYEFIDRKQTDRLLDKKKNPWYRVPCRINHNYIRKVIKNDHIYSCKGRKFTVIFSDTCSVFHRGRVPESDRLALFFCYNSKIPLRRKYCGPLFDRGLFLSYLNRKGIKLTDKQKGILNY